MVKSKYFPIRGTARLVGGAVSDIKRRKKSVRARSAFMLSDIFSRQSGGRIKVITARTAIPTQGKRRLNV